MLSQLSVPQNLSNNASTEILTRVNGRESVELEIYKEADANIVAVAQAVRDRLGGTPEQQAYVARLAEAEAADDAVARSARRTRGAFHPFSLLRAAGAVGS